MTANAEGVERTHNIMTSLAVILSSMTEAESGPRGYVITGDKKFLEHYQQALTDMQLIFNDLQELIKDPEQKKLMHALLPRIEERVAYSKKIVELNQNKGFEEARKEIASGKGKNLQDEIRRIINQMNRNEIQLLQIRELKTFESSRYSQTIIFAGSSMAILFLSGAFIFILIDLEKRKLSETRLRESEDRFQLANQATSSIIWDWNLPTDSLWRNNNFKLQFGYDPQEIMPGLESLICRIHPEERYRVQSSIQLALDSKQNNWSDQYRFQCKSGEFVYIEDRAYIVRDSEGIPLRMAGAMMDVSELKKAESQIRILNTDLEQKVIQRTAQLEASIKELEAFSYSVSHDLRAPLRAVHGYTQMLTEDYENVLDAEGKRICNIISSSATQMGLLIDDLLRFSRISRNSMNPGLVNMSAVVNSAIEENAGEKDKERIKILIHPLHQAFGDANLMKVVWNNLVSNAIKYSSKVQLPEIIIGSTQEDGFITYFIKDNGVGFNMKYAHKLFNVFQRLHSEKEFEGNGVGLAIVHQVISKHGGKVWAEGAIGEGATFYFSLPLVG